MGECGQVVGQVVGRVKERVRVSPGGSCTGTSRARALVDVGDPTDLMGDNLDSGRPLGRVSGQIVGFGRVDGRLDG